MGLFNVDVRVSNLHGENERAVSAVFDPSAYFSVAPTSLLKALGVTARSTTMHEIEDGTIVSEDIGFVTLVIDGLKTVAQVEFGAEGSAFRIGLMTLRGLNLIIDAENGRLKSGPPAQDCTCTTERTDLPTFGTCYPVRVSQR